MNVDKLSGVVLVVSIPLALIVLGLPLLCDEPVQAKQGPPPLGQADAVVHGKPCEIPISQSKTEVVYQLNPALDAQERDFCKRQIKQELITRSRQEIADEFVPGEILVRFKEHPANASEALQRARDMGLSVRAAQMRPGWVKFQLNQPRELSVGEARTQTRSAVAAVLESERAEWVEPNYIAHSSAITPTWGQTAIGVQQAWSVATCDSSIGVAVIDTGVAITHTEFSGGNALNGWDLVNDDPIANDDNGHGTHVASIVAGRTVGICPGGTIVAYKVLDETGSGTHDDIAAGIISATQDSRVKILNLSLGGLSSSSVLQDAVSQATISKLVVSASGNGLGEYPEYPARYAGAIPVGAVDWDWRVATFSTRFEGTEDRSLVAPGVNVWGADYSCPDCYVAWGGTSMATPHVSGAAALLWSTDPSLTVVEVKNHLLDNTIELGDSQEYGRGALHVGAAVQAATGATYNLPPVVAWTMPFPSHGNPGDELSILALPQDPDGTVVSATAVISVPQGGTLSVDMATNDMDLWEATFDATNLGVYTATVLASDGVSLTRGLGSVELRVVSSTLPSGWPQYGQRPAGGSWLPYIISDTTPAQLFDYDIGAGGREMVAVSNGRGEIPAAVRIVSSPPCPLGNDYGRRWLFNPLYGISHPDTISLSCYDGIGMFGNSAAIGGLAFSLDEGSGRSDSQDSRLHAIDPWTGRQYWLIQLGYHGSGFVKTSNDGRYVYTIHGTYDGLWKIDLMGRRQWFFKLDQWSSIVAAPVESDGRLFVRVDNNDSGFYALDPEDGSVLWQYSVPSHVGESVPVVSPDGSTVVFCGGTFEDVYALRASDGQHLWTRSLGSSYCDSTPAVTPDHVIQYASGPGTSNSLYVLDLETGEIVTSTVVVDYGSSAASPAVVGDTIFLADYDGMVRAYRLPTLEKVWEDAIDRSSISSWQISAAVGEDAEGLYCLVFAAGNNGHFRAWRWPCEDPLGPTAVTLARFEATPLSDAVLVEWETAIEIETVGFNLWRSTVPDGTYVRVNDTLIPSVSPGSISGASYAYLDESVSAGETYYYRLEELEVGGRHNWYGPTATAEPTAATLASFNVASDGTDPWIWGALALAVVTAGSAAAVASTALIHRRRVLHRP